MDIISLYMYTPATEQHAVDVSAQIKGLGCQILHCLVLICVLLPLALLM